MYVPCVPPTIATERTIPLFNTRPDMSTYNSDCAAQQCNICAYACMRLCSLHFARTMYARVQTLFVCRVCRLYFMSRTCMHRIFLKYSWSTVSVDVYLMRLVARGFRSAGLSTAQSVVKALVSLLSRNRLWRWLLSKKQYFFLLAFMRLRASLYTPGIVNS